MGIKKTLVWFEEVDKEDTALVGGKGANLGEMINAGFPIPYGFIITSFAYFDFLKKQYLEKKITDLIGLINFDYPEDLQQVSKHIRQMILDAEMPSDLIADIVRYYENLLAKEQEFFQRKSSLINKTVKKIAALYRPPLVAIRSSATAEDLPSASFAGQQETYLNIRGENHLLQKVKQCWASLFTPRAIFYRHENKFDHLRVGIAVVVQRMVEAEKSGIAFSIDPITNEKSKIVIEAIKGLGEYIVSGIVTPDHYEVDKRSLVILKKDIRRQNIKLVKSGIANRQVKMDLREATKQKIDDEEILKIALLAGDIEKHYYFPQDIEWAIDDGRVYIVQSRPITTIKSMAAGSDKAKSKIEKISTDPKQVLPILTGSPASPGIGIGPVNIILSPKMITKIHQGDVLVTMQTNPDYVPAMKKASAIVTEKGGRTSHAAIVSRELGIPAVVGAEKATKILKQEMVITVNGATGDVYQGSVIKLKSAKNPSSQQNKPSKPLKTLTKIYVNLAEPEQASQISKKNVDGIGLLRAEFIIAQIGTHPKQFIKNHQENIFVNRLAKDLTIFARAFSPRPVVYRATDFKTNEYRNLKGGEIYEPYEENPMLGFRGAYRYITNPDVFKLELEAIKKVYQLGYQNLYLMIPFIRVPWELIKIKQIIEAENMLNLPNFKLWIMVEVPSCALHLEEFIKIGIDGVSIGTNDLTMMLLGVDRDNEEVSKIYDERHPIVKKVLRDIVATCHKYKVTSSICGQAASDYPQLVEELVKEGISSVSVNPDAIDSTREMISKIENKIKNY